MSVPYTRNFSKFLPHCTKSRYSTLYHQLYFGSYRMIFGKFMAAVIYTNAVNGKASPSGRVPTLVSGTGSRILRTQDFFPLIQAMFHRQDAANCLYLSQLSFVVREKLFINVTMVLHHEGL